MSLMKTLAKVAIGVAAAKGVGALVKNQQAGQQTRHTPGSGSVFGGTHSRQDTGGSAGIEDLLGGLMGGQRSTTGQAQGGLGGLLDALGGAQGSARAGSGGGLDDLLGGLAGKMGAPGTAGASGGLGGLLGALAGAASGGAAHKPQQSKPDASFGELFNQAARGDMQARPTPDQEAAAALMLRAMIQAAKADGEIDPNEQKRLMERLGDADQAELDFVREQLRAPVDIDGLVRDTPRGMEQALYAMSLMGIDLDNNAEAQYLDRLANGLGIGKSAANQIHEQMGVPTLYG